jgi:hypothetical protein
MNPFSLFYEEIDRRLHETEWVEQNIDWLLRERDHLRVSTLHLWMRYREEIKSLPRLVATGKVRPPRLVDGEIVFPWPKEPPDSESVWDAMLQKKSN